MELKEGLSHLFISLSHHCLILKSPLEEMEQNLLTTFLFPRMHDLY